MPLSSSEPDAAARLLVVRAAVRQALAPTRSGPGLPLASTGTATVTGYYTSTLSLTGNGSLSVLALAQAALASAAQI